MYSVLGDIQNMPMVDLIEVGPAFKILQVFSNLYYSIIDAVENLYMNVHRPLVLHEGLRV